MTGGRQDHRRVPILPTAIVLVAAAVMVSLGVWQLQRAEWKEGLIAQQEAAMSNSQPVAFPETADADMEGILYRRSSVDCARAADDWVSIAGRNADGQVGYVHIVTCEDADGPGVSVQAGWSQAPAPPEQWGGGPVTGIIVPYGEGRVRLVADSPVAGLEANAAPDPGDLPNNHLAYAVQWFLFAVVALAIYALALRRKLREG